MQASIKLTSCSSKPWKEPQRLQQVSHQEVWYVTWDQNWTDLP